MEAASGDVVGVPLDAQQLLKIAETLQTTNALSLIEIVEGLDLDSACDDRFLARVSEQLLVNMPVMSVSKGGFIVIVNMHEFLFSGQRDSFADLLLLDTPVDSEADNKEDTEGEEPQVVHHVHLKPGRKPLSEQFPEIVTLVTDYVQLHGFSAQSRRRSQVGNSMGVTLKDLQVHLKENIPELKRRGISRTAIHQLMVAPRQGVRNASRYTDLVQARVPGKDNSLHHSNEDSHFAFAQCNYAMEFGQHFSDACVTLSCDDMNKVHVGTLAVSRYHQLQHFFPMDDKPQYNDHDFPFADSKIIPSGYMALRHHERNSVKRRSRSLPPMSVPRRKVGVRRRSAGLTRCEQRGSDAPKAEVDKLNRDHWSVPVSGPLHVFNRATKFFKATSFEHAVDLSHLLKDVPDCKKSIVSLLVDGGPVFSPKHLANVLVYGMLWLDCDLDCLMVTTHSAGNSAYNKIEHAWSMLSRCLAGVTLSNALPGEAPPQEQRQLSDEERERKLAVVFDAAMDELCSYWNRLKFDGFPVLSRKVPCLSEEEFCSLETRRAIDEFLYASEKAIKEKPALQEVQRFLKFLCQHINLTTYHLSFIKCTSRDCDYSQDHPVQPEAEAAIAFLRTHGNRLCSPTPSKRHPGHYLTFRECCVQQELGQQLAAPDADLPSGTHGRCEFGCHYVYLSARDKDRHERLVHHAEFKARQVQRRQEKRRANAEETGTDRPAKKSVHRCTFPGCGLAFLSAYQLTLHKKMQGTFCHEADRRKAPNLVATLVHANALCSVPVHTSVHLSIGVETEVFVCVCLCVCVCVCVLTWQCGYYFKYLCGSICKCVHL